MYSNFPSVKWLLYSQKSKLCVSAIPKQITLPPSEAVLAHTAIVSHGHLHVESASSWIIIITIIVYCIPEKQVNVKGTDVYTILCAVYRIRVNRALRNYSVKY